MEMVNCYDCKKELKLIDAKPLWKRMDSPPDFLCGPCTLGIARCDDELQLARIMAIEFVKDNQPERSKLEDKCAKCKSNPEGGYIITEGGEAYRFCKLCSYILKKHDVCNKVYLFMNDKLPVHEIEKSMINSRILRSEGNSPWK